MQLETTWAELKSFLQVRKIKAQFIEFEKSYIIYGIDANFVIFCKMKKEATAPDPSSQKDFEDNFKLLGNKTFSDSDGSVL